MQLPTTTFISVLVALACSWPGAAAAQGRFEVGAQITDVVSSEFDRPDTGVGGRFSWHPRRLIGADAEIDVYPSDFPQRVPFSGSRVEGLFGVTAGPAIGRIRPFVKLRPGFVSVRAAPRPIACILIFPPPLSCVLASGRTVFALDAGGGVELFATEKASIRLDVGDRLVRYPGPALDKGHEARTEGFFSHDFRFSAGVGWRF